MTSLASLLNPFSEESSNGSVYCAQDQCSRRNAAADNAVPSSATPVPLKPPKMTKDAAVFCKSKTQGEIRYPPYETVEGEELHEHLVQLQVYPLGEIGEYPRHIPYNSEKKDFLEKTGRESFEAFHYTFKLPGEDKLYTVLWDYNIGLVKITPFFKCCKYSKTAPAKMLNSNPGLRDICHSITGGALVAQGYWMPFDAARAVTATFCYRIRHALVPIFGPEFLALCVRPEDPAFGRMTIDPEIVEHCTRLVQEQRALDEGKSLSQEVSVMPSVKPVSATTSSDTTAFKTPRTLQLRIQTPTKYAESGYGTESEENVQGSTRSTAPTIGWKSDKKGSPVADLTKPESCGPLLPPKPFKSSPMINDPMSKRSLSEKDDEYEEGSRSALPSEDDATLDQDESASFTKEMRAAYMLMQLHAADSNLGSRHAGKRRRDAS